MRNRAMTGIFWIFCFMFASLGFLGGYYAVQNYFAAPAALEAFAEEYRAGAHTTGLQGGGLEELADIRAQLNGKIAPPAVRLDIYCVLEDRLEAVISVLDTRRGTWSLYTFPADTRVELGETRYQRLTAQFPALPQMFEIGVLTEYMGNEQAAEVLSAVFSDMLFCSFKTAKTCTRGELASWCVREEENYTITQEVMDFLALSPQDKGIWDRIMQSEDDSFVYYAEAVALLSPQDFTAQTIAGERVSDGYRLNENLARRQLAGSEIKDSGK